MTTIVGCVSHRNETICNLDGMPGRFGFPGVIRRCIKMKHGVGVIGFGGEGYWQARHALVSDYLELVGVSDVNKEREEYAAEKGIKFYESNEALLADPTIDLVIIATPNDSHKPLALAAMAAGKTSSAKSRSR